MKSSQPGQLRSVRFEDGARALRRSAADARRRQRRGYKSRVREAAHFSSVGDRSGRRVAPRAAAPRNRAHSPRPRNVHSFSHLVRKHGGQRRRADASLRGLSELLQQDRQQAVW